MSDKTIAHLDLTNCSMPYDFFERVIKALGLGECGHNWDAVYDFGWSNSTVETLYIHGENAVAPDLQSFLPTLHEVFDDIRKARMEAFGTDFTVIVLS